MFFGLDLASPLFWSAFGSIMIANIVLSGDNAVVIAMAARTLEPHQRSKAIFWGSAAAIVMRIVLTIVAIQLLTLPYLKMIGAVLLVYIGVDLLKGEEDEDGAGHEINGMMAAIRTILIADLVMSLDNVLAVAAAAKGNLPLLVLGLLVSIPLIIFGATLLTKVMERFPIIITIGAALLGFLAGEMLLTDPAVTAQFGAVGEQMVTFGGILGAILVVALGTYLTKRQQSKHSAT
ncbi:TerC family protein [Polaromonas sp. JS666]|jgi:YjbE family integral membrane protein|uniref:TerC family protein n=1 Tax=Polaromonas sp. (strain JS666 / ATCC BAA-500) TaxID=296591 RepID=UPI000053675D|nr:TerC family protein [Polaromonas sp. JS666]ABE46563.1 Integral membrane protein TerC [Polaromonas sp. JS666]